MKISLNIFTNSTISAPHTDIIRRTYDSFLEAFDYPKLSARIYMDKNPNVIKSKQYFNNMVNCFKNIEVIETNSLSEGYIHAVNNCGSDFAFMLEHDWQFNKSLIKHSLEEITAVMNAHEIYHLRFNKRANVVSGWDIGLKEYSILPVQFRHEFFYCETSVLSNNPHIIDVKKYREKCLPLIEIKPGSKGIEENLTHIGLTGAIYGGLEYPATVKHQDGRKSR